MNTQNNSVPPEWNVYDAEEAICVDTRLGEIQTAAGKKTVLIMVLEVIESGRTLTKFFNCKRLKSGHYSVNRNSDFAMLYRLAIGSNPKSRFSKVEQLLKHLRGINFKCTYIESQSDRSGRYFKVKDLIPVAIMFSDEWLASGREIRKPFRRRQSKTLKKKPAQDIKRTSVGYSTDTKRIKTGYSLDMPIGGKASYTNGWTSDSIPLSHLTLQDSKVEPLPHTSGYSVRQMSERERLIQYERFESETTDEYWDRVITTSLNI